MTAAFWEEIKEELQKGVHKKGHPFRYCTLATVDTKKTAKLRTVVLRGIKEEVKPYFFTDKRSNKVTHLKENPSISFLFYHPKKLLQLKIEGTAAVITDEKVLQKYWSGVQPNGKKDYTTTNAPGNTIKNPDNVEYLDKENHFCIIEIEPVHIEYLRLKRPNHLRVAFYKKEEAWESTFLVP